MTDKKIELLNEKLTPELVKVREQNGQKLQYIEGATAERNANRIFNYQWDKEKRKQEFLYKREYKNTKGKDMIEVAYSAEVRVYVDIDGKTRFRDGTGFGNGQSNITNPSSAYELALKEAETDAVKRALKSLGDQFGLSLYDKLVNVEQDYKDDVRNSPEIEDIKERISACKTNKQLKEVKQSYNGAYNRVVNNMITKRMEELKNENS